MFLISDKINRPINITYTWAKVIQTLGMAFCKCKRYVLFLPTELYNYDTDFISTVSFFQGMVQDDDGMCVKEKECGCEMEIYDPATGRYTEILEPGGVYEKDCYTWYGS